jgi:alpha-L-fucosidase
VLRTVGRWLRVNGDAVYGAGATPFGDELGGPGPKGATDVRGAPMFLQNTQWRYTTKPGKLYVTFFDEPRAAFPLPLKNRVTRAYHLDGGNEVKTTVEGGRTFLNLDRPILNPTATVVVVEFEGDKVIK